MAYMGRHKIFQVTLRQTSKVAPCHLLWLPPVEIFIQARITLVFLPGQMDTYARDRDAAVSVRLFKSNIRNP